MSKTKTTKSVNVSDESTPLKNCFIITPIGLADSETFRKADGVIKSVLEPVLLEFGFRPLPAYEISSVGSITKQVIEHVINDELVIANLTGLNPNVMYELALRHAFKKKVITIAEHGTKLPFDINDQRTIFYEDSLYGALQLTPILTKYISEAIDTEVTSNPVIDSVKESAVIKSSNDPTDPTKYILGRFDRLERLVMQSIEVSNHKSIPDFESVLPSRTNRTIVLTSLNADLNKSIDKLIELAKENGVLVTGINSDNDKLSFEINSTKEEVDSYVKSLFSKTEVNKVSFINSRKG